MDKVKLPHYGLYGLVDDMVAGAIGGVLDGVTDVTKDNGYTKNQSKDPNPPGTMVSRWWDKLWSKEDDKTAKGVITEDVKKSTWLSQGEEIVDIFRQIPGVEDWFSANIGEKYLGWKCPNNTDTCEAQEIKNLDDFVKKTATLYRFTKASIQRLTEKQILASLDRIVDDYNKREALLRSIATTYSNRQSLSIPARIKGADSTKSAKLVVIAFVNDYLSTKNQHVEIRSNNSKTAKDWTGKSFSYNSPVFKTATGTAIIDQNGVAQIQGGSVLTANVGIIATTALLSALAYTYYSTTKTQENGK